MRIRLRSFLVTAAAAAVLAPSVEAAVLLGNQQLETGADNNAAGLAEASRATASASGAVTGISVYVDTGSQATLVAGLYSDAAGHPGTLLAQGTLNTPTSGAWNVVPVPAASVTAGTAYWIAVLSPAGSGTIRFRDRCCSGTGTLLEASAQTSLSTLPASWTTGNLFADGPISAFASSSDAPSLAVTPPALSFSAIAGGANPAPRSLSVMNGGGGLLQWSASASVPWLTLFPASGVGSGTITVGASAAGLTAGTYRGAITVSALGAQNAPQTVAVDLTVTAPAPPPPPALVGNDQLEPGVDSNAAGLAEASRTTAAASGTVNRITVYVDGGSTANKLVAGLYADAGGSPGALLGQGTLNAPAGGAWNDVPIGSVSVTAGSTYWIALLAPAGAGTLRFRDRCCSGTGSALDTSGQTALSILPASWTTGTVYGDGPISAYGRGGAAPPPPPPPPPPPGADPAVVGSWSAPIDWPLVPVHMMLLNTGKVLMYDGFDFALGSEHEWDPATGTFIAVPYDRNLFCAGHLALADGRALIVGGHVSPYNGLADTTIFDPLAHTWSRKSNMARSRWYPTATMLPDGRVLVVSGDNITRDRPDEPTPYINASFTLPEVYDPVADRWTSLPSGQRWIPLYPFMFVGPNGRVFEAGPDTRSQELDVSTGTWSGSVPSSVDGHSAVMYAPGQILKSGTWADPCCPGQPVSNGAAVVNLNSVAPTWRNVAPMAFPRSYHTLTALPDGSVLATGGSRLSDGITIPGAVYEAELWDPATETWRTLAAMQTPRLYHSSALLLPDGRVLVAGGGRLPSATITDQLNAEIYSPPYLFKGPRPTITSAPSVAVHGKSFTVRTPDAARIAKAHLVRLGAVTHNFDQEQRLVPLNFQTRSGSLVVSAPANAAIAPPGYYMLFLVDANGVPSVASFVRLPIPDPSAPPAPTVTSRSPVDGATGVATTAQVSATFSVAMDPSTITASSFTLEAPGGSLVPATVAYGPESQTATLAPAAPLAAATTYTARLEHTVAAPGGNELAAPVAWTFSTGSGAGPPPGASTVRINAGGGAYPGFNSDLHFVGGQLWASTAPIAGTTDDALYQDERWEQFSYAIPVANGVYDVRLHFVELFYPAPCAGRRVFSIDVLGTPGIDVVNLDICAAVGPNAALVRVIRGVNVQDGAVHLQAVYGAVDDPELAAIEVVPAS
ncbi:MAG TPA: galactose oxidase-like domain-containing protein [Gaiellaceae bacterium]|nr:galactose oxidase-like domain-containing protein [Gaiellaceae bacterium]